ncbi:MAG: response regulator transcription factor [Caldilineaceae bacterium]|nr:response regulator transcription factor [Caldilineaceae bacterium]MCB9138033.1 response regulator transcription factor [Caldilineaceae bacterium]
MQNHLLVVDDELDIVKPVAAFLERAGFRVTTAGDGIEAQEKIAEIGPDLVILDVDMPRMNGRAVLRSLRGEGNDIPVILLTKYGEASERAQAIGEGADDYLNKPFELIELEARIRAILRRVQKGMPSLTAAQKLTSYGLVVDRVTQRIYHDGQELTLTPRAATLLIYLMMHPDEPLTRDRLLDAVWGWDYATGLRAVDQRILELRRVLDEDSSAPRFIETVSGVGYRYIAPVSAKQ